jgi:hypothetical protein
MNKKMMDAAVAIDKIIVVGFDLATSSVAEASKAKHR